MAKIFVGLPVMGGFYPMMVHSLIRLVQENPGGHEFQFDIIWNESLIPRARNRLATNFLTTGFDQLLFIDADLSFPVDAVNRLLCHDKPIVAAPYVVKSVESEQWAVGFAPEDKSAYVSGLVPVDFVSGGFTLIKREVLETLRETVPRYVEGKLESAREILNFFSPCLLDDADGVTRHLAEDWAFCHRAREAGYQAYEDFDIRLSHFGTAPFSMQEIDGKLPRHRNLALAGSFDAAAEAVNQLIASWPKQNIARSVEELIGRLNNVSSAILDIAQGS